jgi:hypothetical protein
MLSPLKKASLTNVDQNATQIYGKATFDWEFPTSVRTGGTLRAFYNSPVHEQWLHASRRSFGVVVFASTGSHCKCVDFTVPEINCVVQLYFDFVGEHTIQPHWNAVFSSRIDKCQ